MKNFFKTLLAGFMLGFSSRPSYEVDDQDEHLVSASDDVRSDHFHNESYDLDPDNLFHRE